MHSAMHAKNRVVRIDDPLWEAIRAKAAEQNVPIAEVVRTALTESLSKPKSGSFETLETFGPSPAAVELFTLVRKSQNPSKVGNIVQRMTEFQTWVKTWQG